MGTQKQKFDMSALMRLDEACIKICKSIETPENRSLFEERLELFDRRAGDIPYEMFEDALIKEVVENARTSLQSMHVPPSPMPALYSRRLAEMDEDIAKRMRDVMSQLQRSDACLERRLERGFCTFNVNLGCDREKYIGEAGNYLRKDSTPGFARDKAIVSAITENLRQRILTDK